MKLLDDCKFPPAGTAVDLAVSGGPDSLGLLLLALDAGLRVRVHHVDHHVRATSTDDARYVEEVCARLEVPCEVHDVRLETNANFEALARAARRRVLPGGVLTGHTMDDLAETVMLNMLRGAGIEGLSPMVSDPTKPLQAVRRRDVHYYVIESNLVPRYDETNDSLEYRRNRVRHELLPVMNDVAERDVVPLLARQARVLHEDRRWLDELALRDATLSLDAADCRDLMGWPVARLTRWLRERLVTLTAEGETYPPSADEIARALSVVRGDVVACELSGARRLARSGQRLTLV
ncbi:MAG: tRNA lysidine(34) synthetase TilS [Acidimicrobiaceae bacterium]|nr:tRNA lysidine(34) synthetase TilS [Acidimicrobiaceae bacterium]